MNRLKRLTYVIVAVMTFLACNKISNADKGGTIQAEDLTLNVELSTQTPVVYNGGHLAITISTNRSQLKIGAIDSEFEFPEVEAGATYDINKNLTFTSSVVTILENGEGNLTLTIIDEKSQETRELSVSYTKTTEYELKPTSITLSESNRSLSMDETIEIGYSINPVQSHGNIALKRDDIYDTDVRFELDQHKSTIKVTGGSFGGKVRLKAYAVADTTVCTYLDLYVKHRVALELDIKSTGNSMDVFWREMPTQATARLVTWSGKIDEENSQKYELSIKEFTLPTEYKASFYVNINTNQIGRWDRYFRGGNSSKVWRNDIKWEASTKKYSQWGEKNTAVQWSWWKHIKDVDRYSSYKSTRNLMDELATDKSGYHNLPILLTALRDNNDYRFASNNGKTGEGFGNGWWNYTKWQLYYITVENIVYDKTKIDLEYVFHRYRMKINGAYYSGTYYWHDVDQGNWAIKVNESETEEQL